MKSVLEVYAYLKLCWNRTMSHISIPLSIFDKVLMILILLKVSGTTNYFWWVILGSVLVMCLMIVIGHYDLKMGLLEIETSLNNKFNPEIKQLVEKSNEQVKF